MKRLQTHEVKHLLQVKYSAPAWALLFEVPDGTGGHKSRSADALAMSLYPSRGLELNGFEIKVSRSDWQKELKDPTKAEAICRYCDRWWIVAGDASIVQDGELPPTWGLLVARGGKLVQKVKAPKLQSQQVTRPFLAAMLRRTSEQGVDKSLLQQSERAGYERGYTSGQCSAGNYKERFDKMQEKLNEFEEATGFAFDQYPATYKSGKEIGEKMIKVLSGYYETPAQKISSMADQLEIAARQLRKEIEPPHQPTPEAH